MNSCDQSESKHSTVPVNRAGFPGAPPERDSASALKVVISFVAAGALAADAMTVAVKQPIHHLGFRWHRSECTFRVGLVKSGVHRTLTGSA
jgi:hypothetical protein